tara:strand:- start:4030 stop:4350 length:321 start_codon:yes stop_codon:yes gene_type:complete
MKTIQEQIEDFRARVAEPSAHVPMTGKLITELAKSIDLDKPNEDGDADPRCVAIRNTLQMIGNRNRVVLVSRNVVDLLATKLPTVAKSTPAVKAVDSKSKPETSNK